MDLNSPEFYTIAFVVAIALVALLMGRTEKKPPSTHLVQLGTTPADGDDADDELTIEPIGGGRLMLSRRGLSLGEDETVNLVITVQEERCSIVEKKGVKRRGSRLMPVTGATTLKCLRPDTTYRVRYESQLTSAWATFTINTSSPEPLRVTLKY